ncbi:MAG: hypothetical protein LUH55_05115 [Bacteroides thetaiotaomicron]|nr:hypothetical protein [Bacteroides thetaiotaomicron]
MRKQFYDSERDTNFIGQCIIFLLVIIGSVLLLSGCGSTVASEKQIRTDLEDNDVFYKYTHSLQLQISSISISKRQTDKSNKTDTIWIEVDAESDAVSSVMYYTMTYGLYNDGWLLDTVEVDKTDEWSYYPLTGVEGEELRYYIGEDAEIISNEVDLETGTQEVSTYEVVSYTYCDIYYRKMYSFIFGGDYYNLGTWRLLETKDIGTSEEWDIDGTWKYVVNNETTTLDITVIIQGFDPQGIAYIDGDSAYEFAVGGSYYYYYNSKYFIGSTDISDEDGLIASVNYQNDNSVYYKLNTDCYTYGNRHCIAVYPDHLLLNPWSGDGVELTRE